MRCDEVIRELATPSDCRDDQALAVHLAHCKPCADWANRAEKLDRLWDMTRPADPGSEAWGTLWTSVNAAIDSPDSKQALRPWRVQGPKRATGETTHRSSKDARFWRGLAVVGTIVLAQAAAIILVFGVAWHHPAEPDRVPVAPPGFGLMPGTVANLESVIDVEDGQVVYIRSEGSSISKLDLTALELPNGEDPWYVFFGRMESGPTVVAMTE